MSSVTRLAAALALAFDVLAAPIIGAQATTVTLAIRGQVQGAFPGINAATARRDKNLPDNVLIASSLEPTPGGFRVSLDVRSLVHFFIACSKHEDMMVSLRVWEQDGQAQARAAYSRDYTQMSCSSFDVSYTSGRAATLAVELTEVAVPQRGAALPGVPPRVSASASIDGGGKGGRMCLVASSPLKNSTDWPLAADCTNRTAGVTGMHFRMDSPSGSQGTTGRLVIKSTHIDRQDSLDTFLLESAMHTGALLWVKLRYTEAVTGIGFLEEFQNVTILNPVSHNAGSGTTSSAPNTPALGVGFDLLGVPLKPMSVEFSNPQGYSYRYVR